MTTVKTAPPLRRLDTIEAAGPPDVSAASVIAGAASGVMGQPVARPAITPLDVVALLREDVTDAVPSARGENA